MRRGLFLILVAPGAALLIFFFLLPLAAVTRDAFTGGGSTFARVLNNDLFWGGLRGTATLAATASVLSLLVGFAVALHLSRLSQAARTLLVFFIALPLNRYGDARRVFAALAQTVVDVQLIADLPQMAGMAASMGAVI